MGEGYDPIPDLALILTRLQVPLSIAGGAFLGEAASALERLRFELDLFGYPDQAAHEAALRHALALRLNGWVKDVEAAQVRDETMMLDMSPGNVRVIPPDSPRKRRGRR